MSVFQLPKWTHPDFRIPGKKPVGDVEVDWDHPLVKGLVFAYIPLMQSGLVHGANVIETVGATELRKGEATLGNGSFRVFKFGNIPTGNHLTVVCDIQENSVSENATLFSVGATAPESTSTVGISVDSIANGGIRSTIGATTTGIAGNWSSRNDGFIAVRYDQAAITTDYVRTTGERHQESAVSTDSVSWYDGIFVGRQIFWGTKTSHFFRHVLLWDRALSDVELEQIRTNPYQILKPANPLFVFADEGAAPPAGSIAPLSHHHRFHNMAG